MRLIDADVLNKDLDWYDLDVCGHCGNEFAAGFEAARELVALAPTIDAVPVVRCKDCLLSEKIASPEGFLYCIQWDTVSEHDGFCHKGTKAKEGC